MKNTVKPKSVLRRVLVCLLAPFVFLAALAVMLLLCIVASWNVPVYVGYWLRWKATGKAIPQKAPRWFDSRPGIDAFSGA